MNQENAIKKAAEDMKFYKLELINREHSYNNMFGNNPNVGVINPMALQTKSKSTAGAIPVTKNKSLVP